ncbi:stage II sporulation protein D [Solibacillus sp. R5-41]|uniref:stage II sporulation protein D n=1 Tax=Solibacillus sp. R5-41 TaxID=2048654 RepID=UPI0020A46422|nr:stage II sporulation protein D [Solibacillus sp. R5-41]
MKGIKSTPQTLETPEAPEAPVNQCVIYVKVNDEEIALNQYLVGVLAGEMPASFHAEALKAQAIAARTYALRQTDYGKKEIQATTAHQVFESEEKRKEKWKAVFSTYENKIEQAIAATGNQVLTYDGQLITAMFHASSSKQTESAKNYSGQEIPYLRSAMSIEKPLSESVSFSFAELNERLKQKLSADAYRKISFARNDTNRIQQVTIDNVVWSGREFRELLQLKSTDFSVKWSKKGLEITTRGYGHGVGMSQHGANAMAKNGTTVEGILKNYYPGAQIEEANYCKEVSTQ